MRVSLCADDDCQCIYMILIYNWGYSGDRPAMVYGFQSIRFLASHLVLSNACVCLVLLAGDALYETHNSSWQSHYDEWRSVYVCFSKSGYMMIYASDDSHDGDDDVGIAAVLSPVSYGFASQWGECVRLCAKTLWLCAACAPHGWCAHKPIFILLHSAKFMSINTSTCPICMDVYVHYPPSFWLCSQWKVFLLLVSPRYILVYFFFFIWAWKRRKIEWERAIHHTNICFAMLHTTEKDRRRCFHVFARI